MAVIPELQPFLAACTECPALPSDGTLGAHACVSSSCPGRSRAATGKGADAAAALAHGHRRNAGLNDLNHVVVLNQSCGRGGSRA